VNSLDLKNKVLVIIGGTTGLGRSAARACVAAGGRVVVVARNAENLATIGEELGDSGAVVKGDATHPETAPRAIAEAVTTFGGFDGLYHIAGGSGRSRGDGPLDEISDEGWRYTVELNLDSLFYSNRAAVRQFLQQKTGGSILNMGSVLGSSPSPDHFATHAYATTKAAVVGLTKSAAAYYAPRDIRFNVIAPALVDTPLAARAADNSTIMDYIAHKQPLDGGRIGRPEDLDAAVVYFLSDSSRFATGQVLAVDGGWMISEGQPRSS